MRLLDRYLLDEIVRALVAILLILVVTTVGFFLGDTLSDVARGKIPAELLLGQLGLRLLGSASLLLPLAAFLAILMTLGRLHRDSEMVVMSACGFARYELFRPLGRLAVPGIAVLLVLGLWVSPWTQRVAEAQIQRAASEVSVAGLQPGRFHPFAAGESVVYVETSEPEGQFLNAFAHVAREGRYDVITARSGFQYTDPETGARYIALLQGMRSEGVPGEADFRVMHFERNDIRIPDREPGEARRRIDALTLAELLEEPGPEQWAELHWRLAPALALVALVALAVPLSRGRPREGYYGNLVAGILAYVTYANLLALARKWVEQGQLPPWLGLWWLPVIAIFVAMLLLASPRRRRRRRRAVT